MATGAFLVYGGWAAYTNWEYGFAISLVSAITQGTISFLVTAFLTLILEQIFQSIDSRVLRFIVTALGAQTVVALMTFMRLGPMLIIGLPMGALAERYLRSSSVDADLRQLNENYLQLVESGQLIATEAAPEQAHDLAA